MRSTGLLLAAAAATAPFASAGKTDMLIDPREQRPLADLPIRVSSAGRNGFTHVQIPIECTKCFPADPTKPRKNLQDGFLEIDFRITRALGLDGDAGAQVNGFTVFDAAFPSTSTGDDNIERAVRLFTDSAEPVTVPVEGSISFTTVFNNGTHDVKGVVYNLTKVGEVTPGAPTGFRLSYIRHPGNSILRVEQGADNIPGEKWPFEQPEAWVALGARDDETEHFAWKKELDWLNRQHAGVYPGWDQEFVACKTTACKVNKVHTRVMKAYEECVERVERPEAFESGKVPPGCYLLLTPYYARRNMMWVGSGVAAIISTIGRVLLQKKKERHEKEKKQEKLDEQMLEQMEDDAVSYLLEVESKVQGATGGAAPPAEEVVVEEEVVSRKAFKQAADE